MSVEEEQQTLVGQFGTEPRLLWRGKFDYRILSIIRPSTETPDTFRPLWYLGLYRGIMEAKKNRQSMSLMEIAQDEALRLNLSVGGAGGRRMIYGEQVRRGIPVNVSKEIPKPTLYDKTFRRDVVRAYEQQEAEKLALE